MRLSSGRPAAPRSRSRATEAHRRRAQDPRARRRASSHVPPRSRGCARGRKLQAATAARRGDLREFDQIAQRTIERDTAAREPTVGQAPSVAVVSHCARPEIRDRLRVVVERGPGIFAPLLLGPFETARRLDTVTDQREALTTRAGRHGNHPGVDVGAVADQVAGEAVVREPRCGEARLAVMERAHRVVEVRHVPGTRPDRGIDRVRIRAAMAQRRHDVATREFAQEIRSALDLGSERDHSDRSLRGIQDRGSLRGPIFPNRGSGLCTRRRRADPRALEVQADRHASIRRIP